MLRDMFKIIEAIRQHYIQNLLRKKDVSYYLQLMYAISLKQSKCNSITSGLNSFSYKDAASGMISQMLSRTSKVFKQRNLMFIYLKWALYYSITL